MEVFIIGVIIFCIMISLLALAAGIVTIIGRWKVFEKAGKPGWASIVPFYNTYITYELGDFPPLLVLLSVGVSLISFGTGFVNGISEYYDGLMILSLVLNGILSIASLALTIIEVIVHINIAQKFNKSALYGLGLAFLPFIFYMMLGLDKNAVYTETKK